MKHKIIRGDCLDVMPTIPSNSVDMVLCDLPYGTTSCQWDSVIPFEPLWLQYKRIIKDNGAIVLTASQPFTSALVMSNIDMFKYEWIWEKEQGSGYINAKILPLKIHENVLIFSKGTIANCSKRKMMYNPQGLVPHGKNRIVDKKDGSFIGPRKNQDGKHYVQEYKNYPSTIQKFQRDKGHHPTQKPVALFEYLIKTYTNENDTVLDNCLGSGTTCVAAENTNRNSIGIDILLEWCEKSYVRLSNIVSQTKWGVEQSRIEKEGF